MCMDGKLRVLSQKLMAEPSILSEQVTPELLRKAIAEKSAVYKEVDETIITFGALRKRGPLYEIGTIWTDNHYRGRKNRLAEVTFRKLLARVPAGSAVFLVSSSPKIHEMCSEYMIEVTKENIDSFVIPPCSEHIHDPHCKHFHCRFHHLNNGRRMFITTQTERRKTMRQTAFMKVSGDVCTSEPFLEYLWKLSRTHFIVICVGGGTQIKEAFKKAGYPEANYGKYGRITNTFAERQLARDVLEKNQATLQDKLAEEGIVATVIIPVLDIGSVLCHVNGDQMLITALLGFDKLIMVTTPERVKAKQQEFADLGPKFEVIGL